jgi:hypothetical protein
MNTWTVWYSHDQDEGDIVTDGPKLDVALDHVAQLARPEWPALATISILDNHVGPVLYVGFHGDQGALLYASVEDGRHYSRGDGSSDGEPLLYMYMSTADEFPPNSEVSAALVRQAAHEFADTGQRPTCVEWQTWEPEIADSGSEWPAL